MTLKNAGVGLALSVAVVFSGFAADPELTEKLESENSLLAISTDTFLSEPPVPRNITLIHSAHPEGDANLLADLLLKNPKLRVTLIFPPRYFEAPERKETLKKFRVLQSSGQIEVALTLENEPNLPLLGDLRGLATDTKLWNVDFSWPDDIAAQIARGSGQYQKRWGKMPSGFNPPFGYLSEDVMDALERFRMIWCLGKNRAQAALTYFGRTAMLQPPDIISQLSSMSNEKTQVQALVDQILAQPFSNVDSSLWLDKSIEISYFKSLIASIEKIDDSGAIFNLCLAQELESCLSEQMVVPEDDEMMSFIYTPWVRTPAQKQAWAALAQARQTVETYKNSGRATLSKLDAAFEEIYSAESGGFLLSLGQSLVPLPLNERNFVATLANVYRLCGVPISPALQRLFSNRRLQKEGMVARSIDDPFFVGAPRNLKWNDSPEDDFGSGTFLYPTGNSPKGVFDLRSFRATWDDSKVTFSIQLATLVEPRKLVVNPLCDIYLDVNRLPGAGSNETLPRRGPAVLAKMAAWEYAVALAPTMSIVYQAVPGKEPRRVGVFNSKVNVAEKTVSITLPLDLLRGSPDEWRYTVTMSGVSMIGQQEDLVPIAVLANKGEKNFGGAMPGRMVPRYIDLLAESPDLQKSTLKAYESGGKSLLPYVEPE